MSRKKMLAPEVKRLLSGVSDHGGQHLLEAEFDLVQTTVLLGDAIEKLAARFMAVHQAVCTQQETIDLLLSGGVPTPAHVKQLKEIHIEIGQHVNAVVTSLQFQDMTSQLIGRIMKRVAGLRDVLGTLGSSGADMRLESDGDELSTVLTSYNMALAAQSVALEDVLRKVVSQNHMESGDIDLV